MQMPKPTEAHSRLQLFAGEWQGEEVMHPSPWSPTQMTATAIIRGRIALDGFAAIGEYEQSMGGTCTFRGHAVYTYDQETQEYVLHWFDSMGGKCNVFRGRFDGNLCSLVSSSPMGQHRMTYDFRDPNRPRSRMEVSQDGRSWTPFFDGSYTRR